MKVRMRTNLGTIHAGQLGVDVEEFQNGMEPECGSDVGLWLVKNHKADELPELQAVPPKPMQAVPPAPMQPKPALAGRGKSSDKPTPDKEA